MITGVTATVQFLHSDQGHVVRSDSWAGFSRPKEDAVEATSADVRQSLIAVCFGVPGVSAVFLFAQLFPNITHTWRQTSHLYHLHRQKQSSEMLHCTSDFHCTLTPLSYVELLWLLAVFPQAFSIIHRPISQTQLQHQTKKWVHFNMYYEYNTQFHRQELTILFSFMFQ